jgi:hypothetical protein
MFVEQTHKTGEARGRAMRRMDCAIQLTLFNQSPIGQNLKAFSSGANERLVESIE